METLTVSKEKKKKTFYTLQGFCKLESKTNTSLWTN